MLVSVITWARKRQKHRKPAVMFKLGWCYAGIKDEYFYSFVVWFKFGGGSVAKLINSYLHVCAHAHAHTRARARTHKHISTHMF